MFGFWCYSATLNFHRNLSGSLMPPSFQFVLLSILRFFFKIILLSLIRAILLFDFNLLTKPRLLLCGPWSRDPRSSIRSVIRVIVMRCVIVPLIPLKRSPVSPLGPTTALFGCFAAFHEAIYISHPRDIPTTFD